MFGALVDGTIAPRIPLRPNSSLSPPRRRWRKFLIHSLRLTYTNLTGRFLGSKHRRGSKDKPTADRNSTRALDISPGTAIAKIENGIPQTGKNQALVLAADLIWHF